MKHPRQPLREPAEDRGATLVLVLVIVTVIGLVGAALLDFSYTSIRTTFALRDQAAAAYAADGAGQIAVAKLVGKTYPNKCATATGNGDPLPLPTDPLGTAFYTGPTGTKTLNAYVTCWPNTTTGTRVEIGSGNKPANALVTVGDDTALATPLAGQSYSGKPVTIANGNVISNSSINASGTLNVTPTGVTVKAALAAPKGCIGTITPACAPGAGTIPTPPGTAPTDPVSLAPAPVCSSTYAAFRPGLYNTASLTNYLEGPCGNKSVVWFSPGTYYFDFTGTWTAPARIVGGTPTDSNDKPITGLDPAVASTLANLSQLNPASQGACANPSEQDVPNGGVMFVFGGTSTISLGTSTLEICATYTDKKTVPIAIYGPTTAIPVNGGTSTVPVTAETVCKTDSCTLFGNPAPNGHADFHIQGFTWAPNARIKLTLKNSDGQVFNWGLVLRSFAITTNGASPTGSVVQLPADSTGGTTTYSIMYLNVWVCPASARACNHSPGTQQLTAKVQVTGSPATAKVLSWSVQR